MRRDALFGDPVHLLRADLHFELVARVAHHSRVQGLVEVGPGHRDEILDAVGHGAEERMDEAEDGVAVGDRGDDDAQGEQVPHLVNVRAALLKLDVDGVEPLDAPLDAGLEAVLGKALG